MSLATSCLVANLQIGMAAGAPKEIVAAGAKVRYHFYVNTLVWKGNGDRLLPLKNFTTFMAGHLALKKEFARLLMEPIAPCRNALDKFYMHLDVDLMPESNVVLDVSPELSHTIVVRTQKAMKVREARAMDDLWSRLIDPLTHFATTMESGKAFRDATVKNMAEAVELVPRLNFADDIAFKNSVAAAGSALLFWNPAKLRKDKEARNEAGVVARQILHEIERIRG